MLMIILDATIVNVALPSIQDDLGFSQSSLAWVVNAYLIAFGGLLLLAGPARRPDRPPARLPRRARRSSPPPRCSAASPQSQAMLIAARFVQGVGGALASAVILGMIVTMFPEPREQAKAIGVYSFVASAGASIGLLAGGVLTQAHQLALDLLRQRPDRHRDRRARPAAARAATRASACAQGADVLGAVLVTGALMLGVYTIVEAADHGWGSLHTLGLGAVALALLGRRSSRARRPRPRRCCRCGIFRSRNVAGANVVQVLMVAGLFGMFFLGVALPAARARLRRDRDRPGVPAGLARRSASCRSASRRG